jgi:hypothetical protein
MSGKSAPVATSVTDDIPGADPPGRPAAASQALTKPMAPRFSPECPEAGVGQALREIGQAWCLT